MQVPCNLSNACVILTNNSSSTVKDRAQGGQQVQSKHDQFLFRKPTDKLGKNNHVTRIFKTAIII